MNEQTTQTTQTTPATNAAKPPGHPALVPDDMFTPVTINSECDPKGEWFKLDWRWGINRTIERRTDFMYREAIERLHAQLEFLLNATKDGKVLPDAPIDPNEASSIAAERLQKLTERSESEKAKKPAKRPRKAKKAAEMPSEQLTAAPEALEAPHSGEQKAKQIEDALAQEEAANG